MPLLTLNRRLCLMIGMVLPLLSAFAFSESTAPSPDKVAVEAKPNLLAELADDRESGFGFNSFEKTLSAKVNVLNCGQTKVVITTTCGEGGMKSTALTKMWLLLRKLRKKIINKFTTTTLSGMGMPRLLLEHSAFDTRKSIM